MTQQWGCWKASVAKEGPGQNHWHRDKGQRSQWVRRVITLDTGVTQIDSWQNLERKIGSSCQRHSWTQSCSCRLTRDRDDMGIGCERQSQRESSKRGWNVAWEQPWRARETLIPNSRPEGKVGERSRLPFRRIKGKQEPPGRLRSQLIAESRGSVE